MFYWLNSNVAYWHWMVLGLLLISSELLLPSFVLLWFGISAIFVGLMLWVFDFSFTIQLMIWISMSLLNVLVWFKWISPHLHDKSLSGMARETMIGQVGTVIDCNAVHAGRGKLRFPAPIVGSDEWLFICENDVKVGNRVMVREFSGNTLIVTKV